jgi:hypothetical protein
MVIKVTNTNSHEQALYVNVQLVGRLAAKFQAANKLTRMLGHEMTGCGLGHFS